MPIFVHLTSDKYIKNILENGIKCTRINNDIKQGVFCMAVTQNFFTTNQWLRELKRDGQRTIVAVYFRLKSEELVYFGHYNQSYVKITAGQAVKAIMDSTNGLGFEIIIPRPITSKEISKTKHLPQKIGWRYYPEAHGKQICLCPACLRKGTYNSTKIKVDKYNKLVSQIKSANDELEILNLLLEINDLIEFSPHQLKNVSDFEFLVDHSSDRVKARLAYTLSLFHSDTALAYLLKMINSKNEEVRSSCAEGIMQIKGKSGLKFLEQFNKDNVISAIMKDYYDVYFGEDFN